MEIEWRHVFIVEMIVNAIVATCWAMGAAWVARQDTAFVWPVRWRWLVFNWMGTKAVFFWVVVAALIISVAPGFSAAVLGVFTVAHVWVFWRWLHLPSSPKDHRGEK